MGSITYVDFHRRRVVSDAAPPTFQPHLVFSRPGDTPSLPIRNRVGLDSENPGRHGRTAKGVDYVCSTHGLSTSRIVRFVKLQSREISFLRLVKYNRRMGKPIKWHGMTELGMRLEVIRLVRTDKARGKFGETVDITDSAYSNYLFDDSRKGFKIDDIVQLCEKHGASLDWVVRGILNYMPYDDAVKFGDMLKEVRAMVDEANAEQKRLAAEA